jgi:hypothetical protein
MVKVVVHHHVADYASWYPVYTEHAQVRRKHGGTGHVIMRTAEDPNDLVILNEFRTADGARAFMQDPSLPEAMKRGGVDSEPQVWLCEDVETKSY